MKPCKVPVIIQMEALECGAASLAMILAYYKKWVPLSVLREECGVSRDGSNVFGMVKAAQHYGLGAKAYRYGAAKLTNVVLPAVVFWNNAHFVVLCGIDKAYYYINDPAKGKVKYTHEAFQKQYSGVVVCFEKTESFEPSGKRDSTLQYAKKRLQGTAAIFAFIILTNVILQAVGVVTPFFSKIFVDNILGTQNYEWLTLLLLGMAAVLVVLLITQWISVTQSFKIRGKLAIVANTSFFWHVLRLPVRFFSQRYAGDIAQRLNSNENIVATLVNQFAPMFINLFLIALYLVMMLLYSVPLAAIGLISVAINIAVTKYATSRQVDIARTQARENSNLSSVTLSGIEMIETIKSSGAEDGFFQKWAGLQAEANHCTVAFVKTNQFLRLLPTFSNQIANGAVLAFGAFLIMNGQFTTGMLLAFTGFVSGFTAPVSKMIDLMHSTQQLRTNMERIEDVLQYEAEIPDQDSPDACMRRLSGEMMLEHITFGYNKYLPPLVEDFTLHVRAGGKVALVGSSGCGKSTLAKLITNLYQPWDGSITFDGMPHASINRAAFCASVSVVDQQIVLFHDTVRENLRMWDKFIPDEDIIAALKDAQIYDDIMKLEGGLAYQIAEGGRNFSGGQRQRLEIARALVTNPAILILDEATSALDAHTEEAVVRAIEARGITMVVIAHRLSTIRDCDEIIVLHEGKVVERGTHPALYAKDGFYTKLIANE